MNNPGTSIHYQNQEMYPRNIDRREKKVAHKINSSINLNPKITFTQTNTRLKHMQLKEHMNL